MVLQWPTAGAAARRHFHEVIDVDLASASIRRASQTMVPEPVSLPLVVAVQHRPAGEDDRRNVNRGGPHHAAPAWSCRNRAAGPRRRSDSRSSTSTSERYARLRSSVAVGRLPVSWMGWIGNSIGMPPASRMPALDALRKLEMMAVAGGEVGAGLGDADDWPARLQLVPGNPEIQIALQIERRHVGLAVVVPPVLAAQPAASGPRSSLAPQCARARPREPPGSRFQLLPGHGRQAMRQATSRITDCRARPMSDASFRQLLDEGGAPRIRRPVSSEVS